MCVVENMRTDPEDMAFLLCQNKGDIRRSILQLQLWVCSGGGRTEQQILKNTLKVSQVCLTTYFSVHAILEMQTVISLKVLHGHVIDGCFV